MAHSMSRSLPVGAGSHYVCVEQVLVKQWQMLSGIGSCVGPGPRLSLPEPSSDGAAG